MVGAFEFVPDEINGKQTGQNNPVSPDQVRQVYDLLGVDAGYLSPKAASWFRAGRALPINFQVIGETPVTQRFQVNGVPLAVVFFPAFPLGQDAFEPSPAAVRDTLGKVLAAGARVQDARLVIGVSPWGFEAEQKLLPQLAPVFQVLLGGGLGATLGGEATPEAPSLLWSRTENKGQSINIIDFFSLPAQKDRKHKWIPNKNVQAQTQRLGDDCPTDHAVEALLR